MTNWLSTQGDGSWSPVWSLPLLHPHSHSDSPATKVQYHLQILKPATLNWTTEEDAIGYPLLCPYVLPALQSMKIKTPLRDNLVNACKYTPRKLPNFDGLIWTCGGQPKLLRFLLWIRLGYYRLNNKRAYIRIVILIGCPWDRVHSWFMSLPGYRLCPLIIISVLLIYCHTA